MANTIAQLAVKLGLETSEFTQGLNAAKRGLQELSGMVATAEKAVAVAEETTKRSNYRANKQAESKGKGNSGNNTKADAQNFSNVMRVDERLEKASNKGLDVLDKKG